MRRTIHLVGEGPSALRDDDLALLPGNLSRHIDCFNHQAARIAAQVDYQALQIVVFIERFDRFSPTSWLVVSMKLVTRI